MLVGSSAIATAALVVVGLLLGLGRRNVNFNVSKQASDLVEPTPIQLHNNRVIVRIRRVE
jgi:hypothetical protein